MDVFVPIRKLGTEFVCTTFDFSRPPFTNVIDGSESFFRSLVYRKDTGEIFIVHDAPPSGVGSVQSVFSLTPRSATSSQPPFRRSAVPRPSARTRTAGQNPPRTGPGRC